MISIAVPTEAMHRRLPFYLALEEWVAVNLPPAEYFFTWQAGPAVICGRNQDIPLEADLDYCRRRGIEVHRRKSGGGCVFSGPGNVMMSYVAPFTDVADDFKGYAEAVAAALRSLGLRAAASGRNDVEIDGRKVSGNAFYRKGDRSIAHGTLLYSIDAEDMQRAITPSRAKLESKRVTSVSSRITAIADYLPELTIPELRSHLRASLCTGEVIITPSQLAEVEAMEQAYYDPAWLALGGHMGGRHGARIPGVGSIDVCASMAPDGSIASVAAYGDFFDAGALDIALQLCAGKRPEQLAGALVCAPQAIVGITNEQFAQLIISQINKSNT